jgi:hypothetical protein
MKKLRFTVMIEVFLRHYLRVAAQRAVYRDRMCLDIYQAMDCSQRSV